MPQPSIARIESGANDAQIDTVLNVLLSAGYSLTCLPTPVPAVAEWTELLQDWVRTERLGAVPRALVQIFDDLAAVSPALRVALTVAEPAPTGDRRVDAALAALVEYLLEPDGLPVPEWTSRPDRVSAEPWFVLRSERLRDRLVETTPEEFARHNVFLPENTFASI